MGYWGEGSYVREYLRKGEFTLNVDYWKRFTYLSLPYTADSDQTYAHIEDKTRVRERTGKETNELLRQSSQV